MNGARDGSALYLGERAATRPIPFIALRQYPKAAACRTMESALFARHVSRPILRPPGRAAVAVLLLLAARLAGADADTAVFAEGMKALKAADYERAVADFSEAIRLKPDDAEAYLNRGDAYDGQHDYDRAIADFNAAMRLKPKLPDAYYNRGNAYLAKGDDDKAIADYNQALQLNPSFVSAYENRSVALDNRHEYDKAIADCDAALRLDASDSTAHINRGSAWLHKDDYDRAIADFSEAIRLQPDSANGYYDLGMAWRKKGEFEKALTDLDAAIGLNPKLLEAYSVRGNVHNDQHDYAKARADFNTVVGIDLRYASGWNDLAWLQAVCPDGRFRDGAKAVENATKACDLTDWKNADYIDTLAAACAEAGRFADAVKWENKYLESNPPKEFADEARQHLALFQQNKPYHDPAN